MFQTKHYNRNRLRNIRIVSKLKGNIQFKSTFLMTVKIQIKVAFGTIFHQVKSSLDAFGIIILYKICVLDSVLFFRFLVTNQFLILKIVKNKLLKSKSLPVIKTSFFLSSTLSPFIRINVCLVLNSSQCRFRHLEGPKRGIKNSNSRKIKPFLPKLPICSDQVSCPQQILKRLNLANVFILNCANKQLLTNFTSSSTEV